MTRSDIVAPDRPSLPPGRFDLIQRQMTVWEIIGLLGPAASESGSGLMFLAWPVTDGRIFVVVGQSICGLPRDFGFRAAGDQGVTPER